MKKLPIIKKKCPCLIHVNIHYPRGKHEKENVEVNFAADSGCFYGNYAIRTKIFRKNRIEQSVTYSFAVLQETSSAIAIHKQSKD